MKYCLTWFNADGDDSIAGEQELVGVTEEMVREWFKIPNDEPAIYCYSIFEEADLIQPYFTKDAFNFGRYDYFVEPVGE